MRVPHSPAATGAALVALVLLAYLPALQAGFVWDDFAHVVDNAALRDLEGLGRIWLDLRATPQYYPLVHTSFWLEYRLAGASPALYHLDNVALHAVNAVLVWRLLERLSVPGAWLAAAIFALHPVQVESVAWVTERKNVLSGLFYLGAALAYLGPRARGPDPRGYALSWLLFAAALLSKTVTATLPAALALVTWWQEGAVGRRHAARLAPMLVAGAAFGLVTAWLERVHVMAQGPEWSLSPIERCLVAGRALWFYAAKLAWPADVAFIYPRWHIDAADPLQYVPGLAFVALLATVFALRARIGRGPACALACYAGTLLPALGFVDFYPMRYSYVANHFQYLASVPLIALAVATVRTGLEHRLPGAARRAAGAIVVVVLGVLSWHTALAYTDLETLWRDTLAKNPGAWMAHNNLGLALDGQGRHAQASAHYEAALRLKPDHAVARHNLGRNRARAGRLDEAIDDFRQALALMPGRPHMQASLGEAYLRRGDHGLAEAQFREVLAALPEHAPTHLNLARALAAQGRRQPAREHLREALRLDRHLAGAAALLLELEADEPAPERPARW